MNDELDRYQQLQREVTDLNRRIDRLEGVAEQIMARLHDEYKCDSLEEGKALLKRLKRKREEMNVAAKDLADQFHQEYGDKLN